VSLKRVFALTIFLLVVGLGVLEGLKRVGLEKSIVEKLRFKYTTSIA
jgi:hypothetical protein